MNNDYLSIHRSSILVDAHCDVLTAMERENRRLRLNSNMGHVDLPRLQKGGVRVQFFAAFIAPLYYKRALARAMELIDRFYNELEACAGEIMLVQNFNDLQLALNQHKIAAIISIEGGEALDGRLEILRMLHRLGVRSLTLTWNERNELGDGVSEEITGGGLTSFGIKVVQEMNRLKMLVDVSHLAEAGFWDVLETSASPVIASHSNSRKICDHHRNLTDDQIKALASRGGILGLCFYPAFIHKDHPSLEKLLDHVEHIVSLAGVDCIGLGSDFDGFNENLAGLEDAGCFPAFTEGLLHRGFKEEQIRKLLGGNFLRLLSQLWSE